MQSETRQDKILAYLIKQTQALKLDSLPDSLVPVQTAAIAQALGIRDNNVSAALAALHRAGKLVRIGGRPVSYLSLPHLEERLGRTLPTNRYGSVAELLEETSGPPVPSPHEPPGVNAPSLFNTLIGSEGSLSDQVRLAKSAMLYPPHGLHVLITGPTGVGKSLFARAMFDYALKSGHLAADKVLVTFNCANYADNPQLLLSQLFGHVKGAFTGADRERRGLADLADGSILFLDEIHRLSPEGQEKMFLLRAYSTVWARARRSITPTSSLWAPPPQNRSRPCWTPFCAEFRSTSPCPACWSAHSRSGWSWCSSSSGGRPAT